jgi:hypothetical protein
MQLRTPRQAAPPIEFEDMSLALFRRLNFLPAKSRLPPFADGAGRSPQGTPPVESSLEFTDELSHADH